MLIIEGLIIEGSIGEGGMCLIRTPQGECWG